MSYSSSARAQSKTQNETNARVLRALVKHSDNKVCADCKKNDPRWASWNVGCFLCIRCSGIHRSMGTHISKVKSIDLDIWTAEQMESVQKWGNRRCNLYWEAHLKPGHTPAEHKIESFIRSKYESRRWAKDGPPPQNPSVLDSGSAPAPSSPATVKAPAPTAAAPAKQVSKPIDLLSDPSPAPPVTSASKSVGGLQGLVQNNNPVASKPAAAAAATTTATSKPAGSGGGIFDLDWHEPSSAAPTSPTASSLPGGGSKAKNDIMSLFAAKPVQPSATTSSSSGFGDFESFATPATTATVVAGSGLGTTVGSGLGGLQSGMAGLNMNSNSTATPGANPWAQPKSTATTSSSSNNGLFDTQDIWGSNGGSQAQAKPASSNDAFADIWGDFK